MLAIGLKQTNRTLRFGGALDAALTGIAEKFVSDV